MRLQFDCFRHLDGHEPVYLDLVDANDESKEDRTSETSAPPEFVVGQRVQVYPGRSNEQSGVIVEDFGEVAGNSVEIGDICIAAASRRWAVILDDDRLLFVDSCDIGQSSTGR